jgi:plastocyanin
VASLEGRALLSTVTVHLENFFFNPDPVTIHVGDTVHWVWDTGNHTVTSYAGAGDTFNSGVTPLNTGATFDHTFNVAGTFQYRCTVHSAPLGNGFSGMIGTITVMGNAQPTLTTITVTPANQTIGVASTEAYTATGTFSDNSQQNITSQVTWTSSNMAAASITSTGLATGVSAGSSTITAALNGISGKTNLTVAGSPTPTPTPTPTFVSESRMTAGKGAHKTIVGFNLVFSGALDPNVAMDTTHYMVTQPGATKKAKPKVIFVGMAMYMPSSDTVMLMLGKFNAKKPLTLTASGLLGATEAPITSFTTRL